MVEAAGLVESLGVCIEGRAGVARPADESYRRPFGAPASGQELEKVVGHATFVMLLNGLLPSALKSLISQAALSVKTDGFACNVERKFWSIG